MNKNKNKVKIFFTIIILLIISIYLPSAISRPCQGITTAIVIGMGIDKEEDDFVVSLQIVTPDTSGQNTEIVNVVKDKGSTMTQALNSLSYKLGKAIGFEHCGVVIIGKSLEGEDMLTIFDYFYRFGKLALNTTLIEYEDKAEDLLIKTTELNNTSSGSIQNNLHYNKDYFGTSKTSTIGIFFNQYFKKGSTCVVVEIGKQPEEDKSGESGGGAEPQAQNDYQLIKNEGTSVVYKKGKKVAKASGYLNRGFNRLDKNIKMGIEEISGLNDKPFENAKMSIHIKNSRLSFKREIINGKFITKANLKLFCKPVEIINEKQTEEVTAALKEYLTSEVKEKMANKIKDEIAAAFEFCKTNNVDVFNLEDGFYRFKNKEYKKLIKTINPDKFLEHCEIIANVEIYPYK